jgi:hypothetical protein
MENTIDTLFGNGLFSNIYFVDSNPGKIETVEVKKINSEIKEVKNVQSFDLSKHEIGKDGLLSLKIRENVKQDLIKRLNFGSNNIEIEYFKVGFLKRLFYRKDPKRLLETFNFKSDWIITSEDIISELSCLEQFEYVAGYSDVRLVGQIGGTMIFKMKDIENVIYMGNQESITAVFNRNLSDDENGIIVEYLIKVNENLTKIIVH